MITLYVPTYNVCRTRYSIFKYLMDPALLKTLTLVSADKPSPREYSFRNINSDSLLVQISQR